MKMNVKKILSMVMSAAMTCTMCVNFPSESGLTVNAIDYSDTFQYDDYLFYSKVDEDDDGIYDYIVIAECDTLATEIEIPAEIDGLQVTDIGHAAFGGCSSLVSITIPDSVTCIRNYAFADCSDLASITIPDSVTSIGYEAFDNCSSLTSINVSENNKYYSSIDGALFNKDKTELITVPRGIEKYVIPGGVTSIGESAFSGCDDLTSITIPDNVTSIGNFAFLYCDSLTSVTIENPDCEIYDSLYTICNVNDENGEHYYSGIIYGYENSTAETYALNYGINFAALDEIANSGESISIGSASAEPGSVVELSVNVSCSDKFETANVVISFPSELTVISVAAVAPYSFASTSDTSNITLVSYGSSYNDAVADGPIATIEFEIPENAKAGTVYNIDFSKIEMFAIWGGDDIYDTVAAYGGTITVIDNSSDNNDDHLYYKLTDEDEDETYDYVEITGCDELATEIDIPAEIDGLPVISISDGAFAYCSSLASITIPDSVTSIGDAAFAYCSNLESVTIPDSVKSIGDRAFDGCSSLTSINVSENNKYYSSEDGVLFNKDKTELIKVPGGITKTEYIIPDSVTSIRGSAFAYCSSLASITIPDSVTSIGDAAFAYCSNLESVTIPDSVKSIGDQAFDGCSSLEGITIPDSVTSMGYQAFADCSSLTSITIPDSITSIESFTFYNCSGLTSVTIPDSVTIIWNSAFAGCSSLTSITIPDSVTGIGFYAFEDCSGLASITIPDSVTSIGDFAFLCCSNLKSITIENSECEIFDNACTICNSIDDEDLNQNIVYFDGTIYGYENSTAQAYAEKYGYNFELIADEPIVTEPVTTEPSMTTTTVTTAYPIETTEPAETTSPVETTEPVEITRPVITTRPAIDEPIVTAPQPIKGDPNGDGVVNVRDAAFIAKMLAQGKASDLPENSDFNGDGNINVRDAAAIARMLAEKTKEKV